MYLSGKCKWLYTNPIAIILKIQNGGKRMKIWEDDNQKYIKAMMEKNTTEQNGELTKV